MKNDEQKRNASGASLLSAGLADFPFDDSVFLPTEPMTDAQFSEFAKFSDKEIPVEDVYPLQKAANVKVSGDAPPFGAASDSTAGLGSTGGQE